MISIIEEYSKVYENLIGKYDIELNNANFKNLLSYLSKLQLLLKTNSLESDFVIT